MIVAIDGPSAAGKGTLSRRLAATLGYHHLDTGLLYRAVGARLLATGADPADAEAAAAAARKLGPADIAREGLREEDVGRAASVVAANPAVRAALVEFQRRFAAQPPGAVLDGRDIGTVICPGAEVKLYVVASAEVRARRRHDELRGRGEPATYAAVFRDLQERDARDQARGTAPAKPAEDAIVLDTTDLTADEVFAQAIGIVRSRSS
ncbi:MAG: (d)CMP kinase [Alphaproteobacteria bacterium]|nr:(d)CMP kinase [Alphaproteobacteria bacterium]